MRASADRGRRDGTERGSPTRRSRSLTADERGVSIAVSHALSIAITTVLLSGLLFASAPFLESHEQRVADDQLSEIGSNVATQLSTVDRLAGSGEDVTATAELRYPRQVVDSYPYRIALEPDPDGEGVAVVVSSVGVDGEQRFELETDATVEESETSGPHVELSLCEGERITLEGCDS